MMTIRSEDVGYRIKLTIKFYDTILNTIIIYITNDVLGRRSGHLMALRENRILK